MSRSASRSERSHGGVHEVAARGFGDAAAAYEQGRPTYPAAATAWLTEHLAIAPGARVLDLGAGTGKLTRSLVPTGCDVVAVEPLAGMRAVLATELPSVPAVGATAEALPVRTAALDAVVVAQAFHWFDTAASLDELARTIRSGGGVALLWNAWDDRRPWVERIHRLVADAGSTPQWQQGHWSRAWAAEALAAHEHFGPVTPVQFVNAQTLTREGVVDRVATTSHIVSASPEVRDGVLAAVRDVLAADPETSDGETVELPYVTEVYASMRA
ncbi:MAG: class I SAM-dependent methyltransferase [Acidimicrobiia bacterium]